MTDYEGAYRDVRMRVADLLRDRPEAEVDRIAPATPEWRVRDVAAHMGGVCDDIANGNMTGVASNAWTRAQVDKRLDWQIGRVLDDWEQHASTVEPMLNGIGQPMGQLVFDVWTHEQDVRGALGEPGGRDALAAEVAFTWFQEAAGPTGIAGGALEIVTDDGTYVLGEGDPIRTLHTTRFEFLRTVTGRRSLAQLQALECDGPPLDATMFDNAFFAPASRDIDE